MSIKTLTAAGLAAGLVALAAPVAAGTIFSSVLTGDQEVPPSGSTGTGSASYEIVDNGAAGLSLVFEAIIGPTFNFGLAGSTGTQTVVAMHIHQAPRDVNGGIVFGLISPSDDDDLDTTLTLLGDGSTRITGEWDADEGRPTGPTFADLATDFLDTAPGADAPFYLNVHTTDFPGGEIRGQIVAAIPLPATLPLLAGAVLVLGLRRRGARAG